MLERDAVLGVPIWTNLWEAGDGGPLRLKI
ncbi:MAG: hypothetical protein ACI9VS_000487 [Candidatus Binatia bacterium]|jgi:hypothetical protein